MIFGLISTYSILLPVLTGIVFFNKLTKALKILSVFVIINMTFEFVNYYLLIQQVSNMPVFHVYTLIEFTAISFIFFVLFQSKKLKTVVTISCILFYVFSVINLLKWESFNDFNSNQFAFEAVIIFFYCIGYYTELMTKSSIIHLEKSPEFILVSGYFIYFSGTFMLFISSKELLLTNNEGYWILNSVLNILLNTIYTVVLWRGRTKSI